MRGPIVTRSRLDAAPDAVWEAVTSLEGINDEFGGWLRMTAPPAVRDAGLGGVEVGRRVCRSWILLFGLIPIDYDDITLVSLDPPRGFHERSTMMSMRVWEHKRTIEPDGTGCVVTDAISYEPRIPWPDAFMRPVYRLVFRLRHHRLRKRFGGAPA